MPDQLPEREREDAMGAYLMMFAAVAVALPLPIINLIAAIVYYFTNKNKSPFIHFHSLQSLLAQIPTTLMNWGVLYWGLKIWLFKELSLDQDFWIYRCPIQYFIFHLQHSCSNSGQKGEDVLLCRYRSILQKRGLCIRK